MRNNIMSTFKLERPTQGGKPLLFSVESIIKNASASQCWPPFIFKESFQRTFKIAIEECWKMYIWHQYNTQEVNKIIIAIVTRTACKQKISHIPWINNHVPGTAGQPSKSILHTIWLPLGETEHHRAPLNNMAATAQSQQIITIRTSQRIAMDDSRSHWSGSA